MNERKKGLALVLLLLNFNGMAQIGFGIRAGLQQSIPLVMRDSFSGKPNFGGGFNFYLPHMGKRNFVAGLSYRAVSLGHKVETYSLAWQTVGLNLGAEWMNSKFGNTTFYTGINTNYILAFGKNVLSGSNSSGIGYNTLETKRKIVPSIEVGVTFKPRPFLNINFSTIQPVIQTISFEKPTLPGTLTVGIEYRINFRDIKKWRSDTTPLPEKKFTKNLRTGTLYFIEEGTDSSRLLFRRMISEHYDYSKTGFINVNHLIEKLDSFRQSPDSNQIFIAKTGTVVYDISRASTQGLIVYNYKMENPVAGSPLFVRNLTNDINLEDPLVVKKLIRAINKKLYKMYNMYRK